MFGSFDSGPPSQPISSLTTGYSTEKIEVQQFRYDWHIANVIKKLDEYQDLQSPLIGTGSSKWTLRLEQKLDVLSLYLWLEAGSAEPVQARYTLDLNKLESESNRAAVVKTSQAEYRFNISTAKHAGSSSLKREEIRSNWEVFCESERKSSMANQFIRKSVLTDPSNGFLSSGRCHIICNIHIVDNSKYKLNVCQSMSRKRFSSDMESMLKDESGDILLCCGDESFRAHKSILSVRSPVFRTMFQQNMTETKQSKVQLTDIEAGALKQLLRYIYTGAADLSQVALQLLDAAEKYDMPELKDMCEEKVMSQITVENAAKMLIISDLHHTRELRKNTLKFIKENSKQFLKTTGWMELSKGQHNSLVIDIVNILGDAEVTFSKPLAKKPRLDKDDNTAS